MIRSTNWRYRSMPMWFKSIRKMYIDWFPSGEYRFTFLDDYNRVLSVEMDEFQVNAMMKELEEAKRVAHETRKGSHI